MDHQHPFLSEATYVKAVPCRPCSAKVFHPECRIFRSEEEHIKVLVGVLLRVEQSTNSKVDLIIVQHATVLCDSVEMIGVALLLHFTVHKASMVTESEQEPSIDTKPIFIEGVLKIFEFRQHGSVVLVSMVRR